MVVLFLAVLAPEQFRGSHLWGAGDNTTPRCSISLGAFDSKEFRFWYPDTVLHSNGNESRPVFSNRAQTRHGRATTFDTYLAPQTTSRSSTSPSWWSRARSWSEMIRASKLTKHLQVPTWSSHGKPKTPSVRSKLHAVNRIESWWRFLQSCAGQQVIFFSK